MASFRPLSTRGPFVPGGILQSRGPRDFMPLPRAEAARFRPSHGSQASAIASDSSADARSQLASERLEPENAVPSAPESLSASTEAVPAAPSEAELQAREELEKAIEMATRTASEFAERERVREEEHAQLRADLELQKEKTRAASERLGQLAGELVRLRTTLLDEVRAHAGHLLLAGARRLAGASLRGEPGLLETLVSDTIVVLGSSATTVRVNPEDLERVQTAFGTGVRVVADTSIRNGCIVEGEGGLVDATVDSAAGSLLTEVQAWKRSA